MPVNKTMRLLRVERTEICIEGLLPEDEAHNIFIDITNDHPTITMLYSYDEELNQTTVRFLPYRVYSIDMTPEVKKHVKSDESFERKIVVPGIVASYREIIDELWMPAKKRAKQNSDDLQWVVVTARIVKDDELKTVTTEISFYIEVYNGSPKEPRGCKKENIKATLDRATDLMTERLQRIIADDENGVLEANHVLNEISMRFAETVDGTI